MQSELGKVAHHRDTLSDNLDMVSLSAQSPGRYIPSYREAPATERSCGSPSPSPKPARPDSSCFDSQQSAQTCIRAVQKAARLGRLDHAQARLSHLPADGWVKLCNCKVVNASRPVFRVPWSVTVDGGQKCVTPRPLRRHCYRNGDQLFYVRLGDVAQWVNEWGLGFAGARESLCVIHPGSVRTHIDERTFIGEQAAYFSRLF